MKTPENKNNKIEQESKPPNIKFNAEKGTLLLDIDKNSADAQKVRKAAKKRGLIEKNEIHLTVIGSDTAEAILISLEKIKKDERIKALSQIQELARRTNWKFNFKPEFYYIKKEYNDSDPNNPSQTIPETRQSIIQMAEIENLASFYQQLEKITGLRFEIPLPHVTLFTTSTREDKRTRGIGIYSEKDFKSLNPERIEIK